MEKYKCKTCRSEFEEYSHDYKCGVCDGEGCFNCGGDGDIRTKHIDYCRPCLMAWFEENED